MKTEKEYTDKQLLFLDALMSDECKGNIKKAMKAAGYAETTHSRVVGSALKEEREPKERCRGST